MKKIMPLAASIALILVASAFASAGTLAIFSDTETSVGNSAAAGVLDLKVKGSSWDDDPLVKSFTISNMVPGQTETRFFKIKNAGTVPGNLTLKVKNPISHENGLEEPEIADGDAAGQEIDPSGYDANGGNGELWDQVCLRIYIDENNDGDWDFNDAVIYSNFGTPSVDYSSYYSIPLDTNLLPASDYKVPSMWIIMDPGAVLKIGVDVYFVDDTSSWWWGGQSGLTNNMAMSDDVTFDIEFGLVQVE